MTTTGGVDVLVITHARPDYARRSLGRLLETATPGTRVWLWHNGGDEETLDVARQAAAHPNVHRFHHSPENQRLTAPTNWLWRQASGEFVAKIDDDCLVEPGWAERLAEAHRSYAGFGVLASWRFYDEDFVPEVAERKIQRFPGGHQVMRNLWVQGSGYLMKRVCVTRHGLLRRGQSFTDYCIRLGAAGWVNGWYYPFIHEEHMDDPRSPWSSLRTDDDLRRHLPLSAANRGIRTLTEWEQRMRRSAWEVQAASLDPAHYIGWRARAQALKARCRRPRGEC